jgi:hypothetical protein
MAEWRISSDMSVEWRIRVVGRGDLVWGGSLFEDSTVIVSGLRWDDSGRFWCGDRMGEGAKLQFFSIVCH